ncbi:MAG: type VI secretion system tube protein Hcp [Planctomycetia bacterium]|nr:type VI secretion system tube protein Hcp [Planctomycetia bacterium]
MHAYLLVLSVPGNSTDPAHPGWIELTQIKVETALMSRRPPLVRVGGPNWSPHGPKPLHVNALMEAGPHTFNLLLARASGKKFASVVLEVMKHVRGKSVVKHRIRMRDVQVISYQIQDDPGLVKPLVHVFLAPEEYRFEVGSALQMAVEHERPHAAR